MGGRDPPTAGHVADETNDLFEAYVFAVVIQVVLQ